MAYVVGELGVLSSICDNYCMNFTSKSMCNITVEEDVKSEQNLLVWMANAAESVRAVFAPVLQSARQ